MTTQFARNLQHELSLLDVVSLLDSQIVVSQMGKHAFSAIGKLKLVEWLKNVEESHRLVVYLADGAVTSRWTRRCIRQADCIFLVADASCSSELISYSIISFILTLTLNTFNTGVINLRFKCPVIPLPPTLITDFLRDPIMYPLLHTTYFLN